MKLQKTYWALALAGALVTGSIMLKPAKADQHDIDLSPAAVVIQAFQETDSSSPSLRYIGMSVFNSSSSSNAPQFPHYPDKMTSLGQAMAILQGQHFRLVNSDGTTYVFLRP